MTPPETPVAGHQAGAAARPPAVSSCPEVPRLEVLRQRADFLRAARAGRQGTTAFLLQARQRGEGEPDEALIRVGFTCSKKVGNAVARNRAKRRLRAMAHAVLPERGQPGWDYVLIGRAGDTAARPMDQMLSDLRWALKKVHGGGDRA